MLGDESTTAGIRPQEQKFLNSDISCEDRSQQCWDYLKENMKEKLDNLDKTAVWSELKLEITYILPLVRVLFNVHDLSQTHLNQLDTITD